MRVILYNAISADGFIAKSDDDTEWVTEIDWKVFKKMVKKVGCVVMGRRTYEKSGENFPYDCKLNIVMTKNKDLLKEKKEVVITDKNPKQVIQLADSRGFETLLLIGGGKLNHSFLKEGLIDELYLGVHPIILGNGIQLFEKEAEVNLKLLGQKRLKEDLIQLHYKILK